MKKILVTGGAGYIGSHTIVDMVNNGYDVISVDNFSNAKPQALTGIQQIIGKPIKNYDIDLCDLEATRKVFAEHPDLKGVIHFAAFALVGESVEHPIRYYRNNLYSLLNVLDAMQEFNVSNLIFSSSCSVYGNPDQLPVTEATPMGEAESPYARTKQMGEQIIRDIIHQESPLQSIILRYFNPAGSHESAKIGEDPLHPSTHLVPIIMETAVGKRAEMKVFGNDYNTRDGSCIRDYIHIMDLAHAHTLAMQYLVNQQNNHNVETFNLGIGEGVTVLEAIQAFEQVTGQPLNYKIGDRRPGDVEAIYANNDQAAQMLGWQPQYGIQDIIRTAWQWEQAGKFDQFIDVII